MAIDDVVIGALPDEVTFLAALLGAWYGSGHGGYPTMDDFDYGESMTFDHVGDAFLLYSQRSWLVSDGSPLHFERGFLRPGASQDSVELTLAHPLGLTEVSEGTFVDGEMSLTSRHVGRTRTGMGVVSLNRRYRLDGDRLTYELEMQTDDVAMTSHLVGGLHRVVS
ncbi:MAG TPA: FABP family protein [Actinomycetota bacterium]